MVEEKRFDASNGDGMRTYRRGYGCRNIEYDTHDGI